MRRRDVPEGFEAAARRSTNKKALAREFQSSTKTVTRWLNECGIQFDYNRQKLEPIPDDFVIQAKGKNVTELSKIYRVSIFAIKKWLDETGADFDDSKLRSLDRCEIEYKKEIERCLNCKKPSCYGNCSGFSRHSI